MKLVRVLCIPDDIMEGNHKSPRSKESLSAGLCDPRKRVLSLDTFLSSALNKWMLIKRDIVNLY